MTCIRGSTWREEATRRLPLRETGGRTIPANAAIGATGMPDAIRVTVSSVVARPERSGLRVAVGIAILVAWSPFAPATGQELGPTLAASKVGAYASAFLLLDRHEIAALALTLGVLCFAVVTAIMLVRTRRRLAAIEACAA